MLTLILGIFVCGDTPTPSTGAEKSKRSRLSHISTGFGVRSFSMTLCILCLTCFVCSLGLYLYHPGILRHLSKQRTPRMAHHRSRWSIRDKQGEQPSSCHGTARSLSSSSTRFHHSPTYWLRRLSLSTSRSDTRITTSSTSRLSTGLSYSSRLGVWYFGQFSFIIFLFYPGTVSLFQNAFLLWLGLLCIEISNYELSDELKNSLCMYA